MALFAVGGDQVRNDVAVEEGAAVGVSATSGRAARRPRLPGGTERCDGRIPVQCIKSRRIGIFDPGVSCTRTASMWVRWAQRGFGGAGRNRTRSMKVERGTLPVEDT